MGLPCGKRFITLLWCILECLFFSGLLNGWTNLQEILKEDKYYLDSCNSTLLQSLDHQNDAESFANLQKEYGPDNPFTHITDGVKYRCVFKKVLKTMTISEYNAYKKTHTKKPPVQIKDVYCDEQDEKLEFVVSLVIIIRNILMLPLGIFLDRYGTSRTRIIAM